MSNPRLSTIEIPVLNESTGEVTNVSYDFPASGSSITIDDEIDSTSENPVQNKVIAAALDEKVDSEDLGTAATRDVPTSGNANVTQVVIGSDTRLTNDRNAADVHEWAKAENKPSYTASEVGAIDSSLKGANNGVAELDANGLVPSSQLPSYVDDVLEYDTLGDFPLSGETGKIYVALDTNLTYRWSGTAYVEISKSLALGETSSTAYRGDRGKTAYDHSQLTSGNPHNVTKSDVGLGNVGNFKAVSTVASQGLTTDEQAAARANIGAGTSSLALGTSSTTAYRGDRGNSAYAHAVTNKGAAFASGFYKITTNSEGHVTAATAVAKADITGLGIPGSDTNTHRPIQVNGTEILGNNTTALNLKAGSNVSVTNSSGTVTIAATDTTYGVVSSSANGLAPKVTDTSKFLKGDGTWATPTNTTYSVVSTSANGLAPKVTDTSKFLKGDGTWATPTDTNTVPSAYCSTAAATAAKTATCTNYVLTANTWIHVLMTTANTSATALTLNINGKGAKAIGINGSASSTSNYTLPAGSYLVKYDGTTYWFRTDGKLPASISGDAATVGGFTVGKSVPSNAVFTDTNTYVKQSSTTTSNWRKVLLGSQNDASAGTAVTEATNQGYVTPTVEVQPSTGTLNATALTATTLNGVTIGSSPKFTDTNTKVTSAANHYAPAEDTSAALSADASSSTAATWGSTDLVTGVNIQRDAKGHVVGVTVDSIQMPANPNSNTIPSAYCSTAAATAAKVASCSGYALLSKSFLHVIITTANTSQTALTLNVNSKGAKPIYINGSASSTSNYTLPAGSYLVYYNGTNYYFRTDGKLTASITGDAATVNGKTVAVNVPSGAVFTDTRDFKLGTTRAGAADNTLYFVYTT